MRYVAWPYGTDPTGQGFFWPASAQKRAEWHSIKRLSPMVAESVYQCNPGAREGSIFLESDFARVYTPPENLEMGVQDPETRKFVENGALIVQAWDTAFSAESDSDHTVGVTAMLVPSESYHCGEDPAVLGPCENHYEVYILHVYRDKVDFAGVVSEIRSQWLKWHASVVVIEKKAYGSPAIEALTGAVPMEPVMPVEGKRSRVIDGLGAGSVQGWFRQHRVVLPTHADWLDKFKAELKDFTGERGRRDDQVDAVAHLIGWAIRNGGSALHIPDGWETPDAVDKQMKSDSNDPFMNLFNMQMEDPFEGTCGRCRFFVENIRKHNIPSNRVGPETPANFCSHHLRTTAALSHCDEQMGLESQDLVLRRF